MAKTVCISVNKSRYYCRLSTPWYTVIKLNALKNKISLPNTSTTEDNEIGFNWPNKLNDISPGYHMSAR